MKTLSFSRQFQLGIQCGDQKAAIRIGNNRSFRKGQNLKLCLTADNLINRPIANAVCTKTNNFHIYLDGLGFRATLDRQTLATSQFDKIAQNCGFNNHADLVTHIKSTYRLPKKPRVPFVGVLISWRLV